MSKALYVLDAGTNWAYIEPISRAYEYLDQIDELWEEYTLPITVNEVEL